MVQVRPTDLISKYYHQSPAAHQLLLAHSRKVCYKAVTIARALATNDIDLDFIAEAAMLHDIGMICTRVPELHCQGSAPYLAHGIEGRRILLAEGLPRHARVCERHTGVGLTAEEIITQKLPLPARDLLPETLEEKIICYADLFFSKNLRDRDREKSAIEVRAGLVRFGDNKGAIFDQWHRMFNPSGGH